MERIEAVRRLNQLKGADLVELASYYGIQILYNKEDGKITKNKGWAGHVIERFLGIQLNSSRSPNFGSWELKLISLKYLNDGKLTVKETMAITMIDPVHVIKNEFINSHLYSKLQKALIVSRIWTGVDEARSIIHNVVEFDLGTEDIYNTVKNDYNIVRDSLINSIPLSSSMGKYIQPRTKGPGHGSTSRAFYARTGFLKLVLGL